MILPKVLNKINCYDWPDVLYMIISIGFFYYIFFVVGKLTGE